MRRLMTTALLALTACGYQPVTVTLDGETITEGDACSCAKLGYELEDLRSGKIWLWCDANYPTGRGREPGVVCLGKGCCVWRTPWSDAS